MRVIEYSKNIFNSWLVLISESYTFFLGAFSLAASRLFQLVTFFLPLKILITVSSGHEPSYINWLPWEISFDFLVYSLICMVPFFYIMYIVFGILSRLWFDVSLDIFLKNRPHVVKNKEIQGLKKLHNHIGKAGSELLLCILSLLLVAFINIYLFCMIASLILLTILFVFKTALSMSDADRFGFFKLHRKQCIEYFLSVNFILTFIAILSLVQYFNLGVVKAIFTLLISRMLFQALQRYCIENLYINGKSI